MCVASEGDRMHTEQPNCKIFAFSHSTTKNQEERLASILSVKDHILALHTT
jgi:hypothetical protein